MSGSVTFVPTVEDWIDANRLVLRRTKQRRWLLWFAVAYSCLCVLSISFALQTGHSSTYAVEDTAWMLAFAAFLFASPLLTSMMTPRSVRRMFIQRPSMTDPIEVRWDDNEVSMTAPTGHNIQPWKTLHRWVKSDRSIVLLPTDRLLLLVPTRVLTPEQKADLLGTARAHGPAPG